MERVADYLIKKLHYEGINHVFMVTGRGILFLSDAVAKEKDFFGISCHHEQGASFAAMAYAKAKGDLGACLVSTGCAATNAITATLCAWQDNIPLLFLSGQHMLNETTYYTRLPIRTFGSQEANIIEIVKPITKYAVMITQPEQIAFEIEKAIFLAKSGRKGPVWIDLPLDIQNMRIDEEKLNHFRLDNRCNIKNFVQEKEMLALVEELSRAKRPVLLLGGGVRSAGAEEAVNKLVNKLCIPVVFTPSGADTCGLANSLSIGAVGSLGGSRAGNFALQNADYILAIGTRLCSQTTGTDYETFARKAKIIIVDIDPNEHTKSGIKYNKIIIADAKTFINQMLYHATTLESNTWVEKCHHWKEFFHIKEEGFIKELVEKNLLDIHILTDKLSDKLPDNATVITDAGFEELIVPSTFRFKMGQRCLFPTAQGAMGYAIPAIVGAYFAGKQQLIAIVGDGSIMMNLQELQTIVYHKIPVKIFVVNNDMYAVIRKRQKDLFRSRTIGNDPSDGVGAPCFKKVAECFGFQYVQINNFEELDAKLDMIIKSPEAILCEVICTSDQKYLHKSYGLNNKKRLVSRPLEDLSPFIDRVLLEKEMIIDLVE